MPKVVKLRVKREFEDKLKDGYPLLLGEFIDDWSRLKEEGDILELIDSKGRFIAKAYYGIQNKGYGWILTENRDEKIDKEFFKRKFKEAIEYRVEFFKNKDTTAFRLFNGEGDGVGGLTIDYFDGFLVVTWYSLGIFRFKDTILEALDEVLDFKGIYQKRRFDAKGQYVGGESDYLTGEKAPEPLIIKENGVNFATYLDDGAMVGVFLDQRDVREYIKSRYAKGKSVLNTFSYTGAFSVFAAIGGAKETTSVDLAKRSLPKTIEQFKVNILTLDSNKIVISDVFDYFKYAYKKGFSYDLVVVDPPSFARSKKRVFSASKDYTKLLKEVIDITNRNGVIVASTNAANFGMIKFRNFVDRAFRDRGVKYNIEKSFSLPKDFRISSSFPEGNYLKVLFIRKVG